MLVPPSASDWGSRMDTTKMKARTFNTGKSAREGKTGVTDASSWTESPVERAERQRAEALGLSTSSSNTVPKGPTVVSKPRTDERKSLREEHAASNRDRIREEDPRNRKFDYEKDIASGTKMATQTKKQLLDKGSTLNSSFSGGSYL